MGGEKEQSSQTSLDGTGGRPLAFQQSSLKVSFSGDQLTVTSCTKTAEEYLRSDLLITCCSKGSSLHSVCF
ncbi:hypothetical protein CesoFtcFv8_024904 [Champsocephalus esox]|uniref:Uncharacterized protein n=1 Tax=Champsocephalus esox TaxID=159716 RepID=A0AAN8B3I1_9TELE|nr:hypothetical protein CesoFtcFv8_024904 [Champsocephalus esox]